MADDAHTHPPDQAGPEPTQGLTRDLTERAAVPDPSTDPTAVPTMLSPPSPSASTIAHAPGMAPTVCGQSTPTASTKPIAKPADDPQGHTFGRYRLLEKLGKGGMGVVWKAYDTQLKRVVALKQIRPGDEDAETAERFVREAQAAARLRHPNIVAVHEAGVIDGHHYLTTEYVDAKTLRDVMGAQPLVPKKAIELVKQVAEGLAYAHDQGIIHRDVKPENILVDAQGKAFVMDFGLAKDLRQELGRNLTLSGSALGTPPYMSPEQARGWKEAMGPPTDQFSLGVVLYELLTGKLPFDGTSWPDLSTAIVEKDPVRPTRLNPRLHRDLETICLKALEKAPLRRYDSMAALAADLGRWLEGEPIAARPVSIAERLWRKASRHRRVVVPVVALALAALVGLGWAVATSVRKDRDVAKALAAGREAEGAGNLEGARDAYKAALALAPSRDEAKAGVSRVEGRLRERETARAAEEQQAERLLEDGGRALDLAQRSLYDPKADYEDLKKRVEVGKKLIEEAIGKAPEKARGYDLLGRAWKLLGWEDKAEGCWQQAIRVDPKFGQAHFQLGMLLLERAIVAEAMESPGESREAREERAAGALSNARKELELAAGFSWAGEDEVSKELLRVATAFVTKDDKRVLELAAVALERFGDREGCERFHVLAALVQEGDAKLAALDRALRVCPRYGLAAILRGNMRQVKGDLDGAIADFDHAIAGNPRFAEAFSNRGGAREAKGDHDGAIADCDKAIAIDPRNESAFITRGNARYAKNDIDGAITDYSQAIAINPRDANAFFNRGLSRTVNGDDDGAFADYDQAIAINPRDAKAFYGRGVIRLKKRDFEGAIEDYTKALEVAPASWPQREGVEDALRIARELRGK